jgi:hypothetical protein
MSVNGIKPARDSSCQHAKVERKMTVLKIVMRKTKKKMSMKAYEKKDKAMDKKQGVKENSKKDKAWDKRYS